MQKTWGDSMKIIAFEGIDASGKETQSRLLSSWLSSKGLLVGYETFPRYELPMGKLIRDYLDGNISLSDEAVHMLYEADRVEFCNTLTKDVELDYLVLDRYILSNLAFGAAKGLDVDWLRALQKKVIQPDITFYIDIPVSVSFERRGEGRDIHEMNVPLLASARYAYRSLALNQEHTIYEIDGTKSVKEIHATVRELLTPHL